MPVPTPRSATPAWPRTLLKRPSSTPTSCLRKPSTSWARLIRPSPRPHKNEGRDLAPAPLVGYKEVSGICLPQSGSRALQIPLHKVGWRHMTGGNAIEVDGLRFDYPGVRALD